MGGHDTTAMLEGPASSGAVALRTALSYLYSRFGSVLEGDQVVDDPFDRSMDLHLFLLSFGATFETGTGVAASLPAGVLSASTAGREASASGLGDLEVRASQDLGPLLFGRNAMRPVIRLSLGAAFPTGEVGSPTLDLTVAPTTGDGSAAGAVTNVYAALGRGTWWLLGDAEAVVPVAPWAGVLAAARTRTPLVEADNGIRWGFDVRSSLGATFRVVPDLLHLSLTADHQWRDRNEEDMNGQSLVILNSGGHWVTLTPTLVATPVRGFEMGLSARIPVYRAVEGVQLVEGANILATFAYTARVGGSAPPVLLADDGEPAPMGGDVTVAIEGGRAFELPSILAMGRVTLVDWYADWCKPCRKLDRELRTFAAARADVAVRKVDIVEWGSPASAHLSGLAGLPVLDVYGPDGRLIARLVGDETFDFEQHVPGW